MPVGPELDALIEEKVMGRHVEWRNGMPMWVGKDLPGSPYVLSDGLYGHAIPPYSTDIREAWKVLQTFNDDGLVVVVGSKRIRRTRGGPQELLWYALIGMAKPIDEFDMNANILGEVEAPTAPLAICWTALKALETRTGGKSSR